MDSLEYQKKLAEYDEKISFFKVKMNQAEHEKALFVLGVVDATQKSAKDKQKEGTNAG